MSDLFNKINVLTIVKHHLATLRNDRTDKPSFDDYLTFLITPSVVASTLTWFNHFLNNDLAAIICSALAIFVGLFFNIIVLIFDFIHRSNSKKFKKEILQEILSNISFTIIISVISMVLAFIALQDNFWLKKISHWFLYFFLTLFLLTVLMVLKRMYLLFRVEMEQIVKENK